MPLKTHVDEQPTLNLTPMIDVVFLLIIFFMVGTKFTEEIERKIGLNVPEVSNNDALSSAPEKKVVSVFADGRIVLGQEQVTLLQLTERLRAAQNQYRDLGVLIRGDASSRFQNVAEVLNACKQASISELAISVKLNPAAQ